MPLDLHGVYEQVELILGEEAPFPRIRPSATNYYANGVVYIRFDQCVETAFAHESVHYITMHNKLFADVPNAVIKNFIEDLAQQVEDKIDPWQPNCQTKRPHK